MRPPQKHKRFLKRVETEFTADEKTYRGISSNLSINGLFIRTNHPFVPGTLIDIRMHLPGASDIILRGRVKHSMKTPVLPVKNGMGIEIVVNNPRYIDFLKSVFPDAQTSPLPESLNLDTTYHQHIGGPQEDTTALECAIIACPRCGVKNKAGKTAQVRGLICGKCRSPLTAQA